MVKVGAGMNTRMLQGLTGGFVASLTTFALAQAEAPQPQAVPPTATPAYAPPAPAAYPPPPPPMVMMPPEKAPDPGRHLHDGFYLRTSLGLGPGKATENIGTDQYKWTGTGIML